MTVGMFLMSGVALLTILPLATAETVLENEETLSILAYVFLAMCVIILLIAIIVPMILYRRLKNQATLNSDFDSRYTSRKENIPMGVYGGYAQARPVSKVYIPGDDHDNNGTTDSAYATLSKQDNTYEKLQGDTANGNYEQIQAKNSTFASPQAKDNAAYENINGDHYDTADATQAQYDNPEAAAAYDNPVMMSDDAQLKRKK
ncbi:uncharacterized protein LOC125572280 [Nematostella vectensis]|uniref:uncharacterized protein LOC125572280 n=1 Tax=Nematostella vectensis TaxID=45351 RepID=UPI002076EC7F|nr:uncharacterized protein LOC125572280 [Nematostella vectensis]